MRACSQIKTDFSRLWIFRIGFQSRSEVVPVVLAGLLADDKATIHLN